MFPRVKLGQSVESAQENRRKNTLGGQKPLFLPVVSPPPLLTFVNLFVALNNFSPNAPKELYRQNRYDFPKVFHAGGAGVVKHIGRQAEKSRCAAIDGAAPPMWRNGGTSLRNRHSGFAFAPRTPCHCAAKVHTNGCHLVYSCQVCVVPVGTTKHFTLATGFVRGYTCAVASRLLQRSHSVANSTIYNKKP